MATVGEPPAKTPERAKLEREDVLLCLCEGVYNTSPRPGATYQIRLQQLHANAIGVVDPDVPYVNEAGVSKRIHDFYNTMKRRRRLLPLDIKNTGPSDSLVPGAFIKQAHERAITIRENPSVELMRVLARQIGRRQRFVPGIETKDRPISLAHCKDWYEALSSRVPLAAESSFPKVLTPKSSRARSSSVSSVSSTSSTSSSSTLREEETGQTWWITSWILPCLGRSRKSNTKEHTPLLAEKEAGSYSAV